MNFFRIINIENELDSEENFWIWFEENSQNLFESLKAGEIVKTDFFEQFIRKLIKINSGIYFLVTMSDESTAELTFTASGILKNIVFVEELVNKAPKIANWKFTALKPEICIDNLLLNIENKYNFSMKNLNFSPIYVDEFPDEIDILIQYDFYNEEDKDIIFNGFKIFIENYLGELKAITSIDSLKIQGKIDDDKEIIPFIKLKEYLIWRESEFTQMVNNEKRIDAHNNKYLTFKAVPESSLPYIATINTSALEWIDSPSHPWILIIEIDFDGSEHNGMPNKYDFNLMNDFEEEVFSLLKVEDGYINIGSESGINQRKLFFACIEFRISSKMIYKVIKKYSNRLDIDYTIYKDKYWQTFRNFKKML